MRHRVFQTRRRSGILLLILAWGAAASPGLVAAQPAGLWRLFRATNGLADSSCVAIAVSPRGNVWIRHPPGRPASVYDGYQLRSLPTPGVGIHPVHESRSGQIWSLYPEGITEFRRGQWIQYPLAEMQVEGGGGLSRPGRLISLLPAERDNVLSLLPDRLLKCDVLQNRAVVIRSAAETRLGRFTDFLEARDGSVWLAGTNGVARLTGPVRRLAPEMPWQEYELPTDWGVRWLGRPMEDDEGGVTVVGETRGGARETFRLSDTGWSERIPGPEGVRTAWRGLGGSLWAHSRLALFWREGDDWETVAVPGLSAAQYYDVTTESGGVFWLATSEGLVRYAPPCWRVPAELSGMASPTWGILETSDGTLWFAGTNGLTSLQAGRARTLSWPPGLAPTSRRAGLLHALGNDRVLVNGGAENGVLWANRGTLRQLTHPESRTVRAALGRAADGRVWVETAEASPGSRRLVELFDGARWEVFCLLPAAWDPATGLLHLQVLKDGSIWLITTAGIAVWDEKARAFSEMRSAPAFSAPTLLERDKGRLWCGSGDALLESDGRTWTQLRGGFGQVHALTPARDGSVWVASERGLFRFLDGSWLATAAEEGLPSARVWTVWQDQRGELWVATDKGVARYFREADADPPRTYVLSGDEARDVSTRDTVWMSFRGRDRWDLTAPRRLVFSHRIDDAAWSPYGAATTVPMRNLSAGKHRFSVRAMDRNWNEEPEPALFEFTATIPWWAEPRVVIVGTTGLVIAGLLAGLAVNRHLRLLRSYAEVEAIVAQRTRELERANQELLHSQKMRALGTLAAGIAHDFNSILSIIKGSAQIIESHPGDLDKVRTRVDRIKTMVEQGTGIVRAMLGLARSAELRSQPFDLNRVVSEAVRALADQFRQDITFRFEARPELPAARGIPDLCRQMLLNLILNGADAMAGQGTLRVRVGELAALPPTPVLAPAPAARFLYVAVQDHGHGIDPAVLPRIFEPFFTTKAFSTRRGTGLGLTMVYEIAKETGLGLQVESTVGQGSTFTILVPVAEPDEPANPAGTPPPDSR